MWHPRPSTTPSSTVLDNCLGEECRSNGHDFRFRRRGIFNGAPDSVPPLGHCNSSCEVRMKFSVSIGFYLCLFLIKNWCHKGRNNGFMISLCAFRIELDAFLPYHFWQLCKFRFCNYICRVIWHFLAAVGSPSGVAIVNCCATQKTSKHRGKWEFEQCYAGNNIASRKYVIVPRPHGKNSSPTHIWIMSVERVVHSLSVFRSWLPPHLHSL